MNSHFLSNSAKHEKHQPGRDFDKNTHVIVCDNSRSSATCHVDNVPYKKYLESKLFPEIRNIPGPQNFKYMACSHSYKSLQTEKELLDYQNVSADLNISNAIEAVTGEDLYVHLILSTDSYSMTSDIRNSLKKLLERVLHLTVYFIGADLIDYSFYADISEIFRDKCSLYLNDRKKEHFQIHDKELEVITPEKLNQIVEEDPNVSVKLANTFSIFYFNTPEFRRELEVFLANQVKFCNKIGEIERFFKIL